MDVGNAQFKRVLRPILDKGPFMGMILLDIKVGKKYDRRISREKDQDMPDTVKIWETDTGPDFAIELIIDPANDCGKPKNDGSTT